MSSSSEDTGRMDMKEYFEFLELPLEDIELATNNFSDGNQITESHISSRSSSKFYKGQLEKSSGETINIVVQRSPQPARVINEVYMSRYKHKNILSTYKMSETDDWELLIVNKDEASERLDRHLSGSTLTWIQRLKICVGVADALSYLHFDAEVNHTVIHCDINSSNILLDRNWEPKLKGFQFAVRTKKHHLQLISKYNGALQYMDPAYEKTKGLTHKSDVFSFGVVMFEVLFGRDACISITDEDNWYFVRLAKLHYEKKTLDEMIDPDLRKQMNLESFNVFTETAYYCLKEQRSQRLNMTQTLRRLEKALELQSIHEHSTAVVQGRSPCWKGRNLDHLKFRLSDIELATNKFSKTHCIGSGGYGMVYKAKLDHYDDINSPLIEGKNIDEIPKKNSYVAIKRIFSRVDGQGEQGFFAEIEMLSNCKHRNIVSLLGFCDEGPEMILVYEFCPNGSLDEYFGNTDNVTNLTWAQRIQISIDIAQGLKYLHTSTECRKTIIHRDIKSANILLDENWVAKIADFGLSRLHHACQQGSTLVTNNIAGTDLYLDPEYLSTGKLKTKSDIYSLGVVLFEIMCGKLAYDKSYNEKGLPSVARQCFIGGTIKNLVDPEIKEADENIFMLNGGVNQDSLETFSKIAYQCVAETQSERPTMDVIIQELEKALNFQASNFFIIFVIAKIVKLTDFDHAFTEKRQRQPPYVT
ncbi:uncharacterized protein [Rutidosis leptorrhynchoides]|uniref:uncharacterized protein n=1 Tax=Rutidosis leptorrhynchoides TaxID=125765 RepID=UPI003A999057